MFRAPRCLRPGALVAALIAAASGCGGQSSAQPAAAAMWYERSAETGYFRGQFNYAAILAQWGHANAAASWYLQAAASGDRAIRGAIIGVLSNVTDPALTAARARVASMLATERHPK